MTWRRDALDTLYAALLLLFCIGLFLGIFLWVHIKNQQVDEKIQACLASGGTPLVVGHQYTSEFKACLP